MDKYCYNGLLWLAQGEDVNIYDAESGDLLVEDFTLTERKDEIELPSYNALVPIMTSNTTPSGEAFGNSSIYHSVNPGDWEFYKPFNGQDVPTTAHASQGTIFLINEHWGYDFGPNNKAKVKKMLFGTYWYSSETNLSLKNFRIEADNGDDNWISLGSYYNDVVAEHTDYEIEINNSNYYRRYRVVALDAWSGSGYIIIAKAQFYGYKQ